MLQHSECFVALIEKCKSAADKKKTFGALPTDIYLVIVLYLPHELLIAKLQAYGFGLAGALSAAIRLIENKGQK